MILVMKTSDQTQQCVCVCVFVAHINRSDLNQPCSLLYCIAIHGCQSGSTGRGLSDKKILDEHLQYTRAKLQNIVY